MCAQSITIEDYLQKIRFMEFQTLGFAKKSLESSEKILEDLKNYEKILYIFFKNDPKLRVNLHYLPDILQENLDEESYLIAKENIRRLTSKPLECFCALLELCSNTRGFFSSYQIAERISSCPTSYHRNVKKYFSTKGERGNTSFESILVWKMSKRLTFKEGYEKNNKKFCSSKSRRNMVCFRPRGFFDGLSWLLLTLNHAQQTINSLFLTYYYYLKLEKTRSKIESTRSKIEDNEYDSNNIEQLQDRLRITLQSMTKHAKLFHKQLNRKCESMNESSINENIDSLNRFWDYFNNSMYSKQVNIKKICLLMKDSDVEYGKLIGYLLLWIQELHKDLQTLVKYNEPAVVCLESIVTESFHEFVDESSLDDYAKIMTELEAKIN